MRRLLMIGILPLTTSCSTIKPYPVCFYDASPPNKQVINEHANNLLIVMRRYDAHAHSTTDGRWILSKTTSAQHKLLNTMWPRIACIGSVSSGTQVKLEADCVKYIHDFLEKKNYLEFDLKENPVFNDEAPGLPNVICQSQP